MCLQKRFTQSTVELIIILIGIMSFVTGLAGAIIAIYVIVMEDIYQKEFNNSKDYQQNHVFNCNLNKGSLDVIMGIILLICLLTSFFSVLLIVGIKKNNQGFVLGYFSYGILLTILLLICALLGLLQNYWITAIIIFMFMIIYIHCLIMVHNTYEDMQKGLKFGANGHNIIDDYEQTSIETQ